MIFIFLIACLGYGVLVHLIDKDYELDMASRGYEQDELGNWRKTP